MEQFEVGLLGLILIYVNYNYDQTIGHNTQNILSHF